MQDIITKNLPWSLEKVAEKSCMSLKGVAKESQGSCKGVIKESQGSHQGVLNESPKSCKKFQTNHLGYEHIKISNNQITSKLEAIARKLQTYHLWFVCDMFSALI